MELPKSKKTFDAEIADTVKDQMDVKTAGGKTMQGLINRRSREKDVFDGVNPVFPELSEDADLNTAQKYAALNLLLEVESSGGTKTGLEKIGNTVGKYHIKQDKAALVDPTIKKMSSSQFKKYIKNNPDKEEELVSSYLDVEINKMLDRTGVDRSQLNPNEYAAVVSNLYNKGNQPKLLKNTAKLTKFRQKAFPKTNKKTQNINQDAPIQDVGKDIPMDEQGVERFKTKKSTDELGLFPVERVEDVPDKPKRSFLGFEFNEGGAVPMKKQMEMFENGGLKDEGGSIDPVSGNDVPPGSTQEEVRDDIPAQLSEGEFVFPADVVRYIGLGNLMTIRQEAKMGLKMMDEMGQMGNSEEATMPDDLPFDINDLDMEDEDEYNTRQEFAVGGMPTPNPNTGVYYNPTTTTPTTGVAAVPQQAASQQYVQPIRPQQAAVPTMKTYKPSEIPTFTQTIGSTPGQYDELREYKNESGEVRQIPFKAGQPIYPIPEGFTYVDPEATKTEEVTTTPTDVKTQTTRVRDEPGGDEGVEQGGAFGDMERMKQRTDLAKRMGFTEFQNPIAGLVGAVMGTSGAGEQGTITGTGYILDGEGGMYDPITGYKVNTGLVSAIKQDFSLIGKGPMGRNIAKKAEAQKTQFGRDVYNKASEMKVIDKYDALIQEAKDRGDSDSASTADTIKKTMRDEAKKGNIDLRTGMVINPNELAGARKAVDTSGDQTDQTTPDYGGGMQEDYDSGIAGPGNETSGDETDQGGGSNSYSGGFDEGPGGYNQGGLASKPKPKKTKKMKRGGLASKK